MFGFFWNNLNICISLYCSKERISVTNFKYTLIHIPSVWGQTKQRLSIASSALDWIKNVNQIKAATLLGHLL